MKSILRALSSVVLSMLLISSLAACNNSIGSRSSTGSGKPPAAVATQAVPPAAAQPTTKSNPAQVQLATPQNSAPATTSSSVTSAQADGQGDEIERSLDEITNGLNSTDTLDDLK